MRLFWLIIGLITFGLGGLGLFVPILPTTPFWLIAAFAFTRSSKFLYSYLENTKFYKTHMKDIVDGYGMTMRKKISIFVPVSLWLLVMAIFISSNIAKIILISCVLAQAACFFIFIPTKEAVKVPKISNKDLIKEAKQEDQVAIIKAQIKSHEKEIFAKSNKDNTVY